MTGAVAVICRLSPREDAKYEGVKVQERWGRRYAAERWPGLPVEVYADEGVSASDGSERPGLELFRRHLAEGAVAHVCATAQDRVSRETAGRYPWFGLAVELVAAGISELHTRDDGIVQVEGELAGIKAVLARGEITKLARRVNEVREDARRAGNLRSVIGGVPPLGFREGTDDWETEPGAAGLLRDVAQSVLGDSEHNVRAAYRAAISGHPDVRDAAGRVPSEKMVRAALTRPATAGLITARGELRRSAGGREYRLPGTRVIGRAVAIGDPPLDEETWLRLGRVFGDRKRGPKPDGERYWAGPLLRCGKCGNYLTGEPVNRYGRERLYYACKNPHPGKGITDPCRGCSIVAEDVNLMLRIAVERWAGKSQRFRAASAMRAGQATERDRLAAELDSERRAFTRLAVRARRDFDADLWAEAEQEHDATVARIEAQMAGLTEALAAPPVPAEVRWEKLTGDERRALVGRALEVPIRVAPGRRGNPPLTADQRVELVVRRG